MAWVCSITTPGSSLDHIKMNQNQQHSPSRPSVSVTQFTPTSQRRGQAARLRAAARLAADEARHLLPSPPRPIPARRFAF